jgi:hypothetical protein
VCILKGASHGKLPQYQPEKSLPHPVPGAPNNHLHFLKIERDNYPSQAKASAVVVKSRHGRVT